jgi:hypothetical protein
MDMSYTQDVHMSHGTEYFRTSNCVQQSKTYTRKAATVYLNCSTVPCNTLWARIAAAVPCNTLCARIAAAVWPKTREVICDLQVRDLGMQYPAVRHIHVNKTTVITASGNRYTALLSAAIFHDSSRQQYGVTVTRCCSYSCFVILRMGDSDAWYM